MQHLHEAEDMTTQLLPALDGLKAQAKRLRKSLEAEGNFISHSEALELVARQYGYRDWNTIHAAAGNRPAEPLSLGAKVSGSYLGQAFTAEVIGLTRLNDGARYRVTLDLDEAVDVVTFDSFSAWRKRVNGTIGRNGVSASRTSDGRPHLEIRM
nr:glyoxalase superfamily protein [Maricaulis virginensis]